LSGFCGSADNHIWQMGVHFMEDLAFAANPFALTVRAGSWFQSPITIPPWAIKFILAQDDAPNMIANCERHLKLLWSHRLGLTTTLLIEEPAENILSFAHQVAGEPENNMPVVPSNMKEAVQRAKELGATRLTIGNHKIRYVTDDLDFEEDIEPQVHSERVWGVDTLLAALEHAQRMDLSGTHAKWQGNGYKGVFSGMSA